MRVDDSGLERWSDQCSSVARELAAAVTAAPADLPSGQATAAVVSTSQSLVDAASVTFSARVQAIGTKSGVAAAGYVSNDEESARRLDGLSSVQPVV